MCGVVGALGRGEEFETQLHRATEALAHRGIRSRIEFAPSGGIGHVRLPIVGLGEEYDQPMKTSSWLVGFVGEVLNFKELHPELECDAPLVRDTWADTGPFGFKEFDGFWGICALHESSDSLHVFTDYLGQKPMYYRNDRCAAASEIDALLPFGPVTLDHTYLSACIKWGYCPDLTRTPYNEIKHVLPGEHVVLSVHHDCNRRLVDELQPLSYSNTGDIKDEIELAVRRRVLSSDVPVAALVSGGIDSAITYVLAARHGDVKPYFVQSAHDLDCHEMNRAMAVLGCGGGKNLYIRSYDHITIEEALDVHQEPIDLGSLRPQIALAKAIPETVCLTGDGADELFGGYSRSLRFDSQFSDVFQELPAWHLPRLDRAMMHNRIEVRSPFLARRVAGMSLTIPHILRQDKALLRDMFRQDLPAEIVCAEKKALRTPEIARDREYYSKVLVDKFIERAPRREQKA